MVLRILRCQNNQISSLYLINNWGLEQLYCDFNQLTSSGLSLPTYANTPLLLLSCSNNLLTNLDLNVFSNFLALDCSDNNLTELRIKNGNNSNITSGNFWANNNPNLNCIEVDNATYSTSNWTNIDSQTCFNDVACITPTFDLLASVCQGATAPALDTTSVNNISGSWSPATIDTSNINTQTYTFTPTLCTNPYQITISVVATPDAPTGEANQTFNAGQTLADLVVNGDNLVWSSSSTFSDTLSDSEPLVDGFTYYVRSESGNCQSESLAITVTLTVNVSNFDSYAFSYYPNPINDVLHFSSNQPIENIIVTNMLGQQINVSVSSDKTKLDMSDLPTGNYFVKITIDGAAKTIKVVKK